MQHEINTTTTRINGFMKRGLLIAGFFAIAVSTGCKKSSNDNTQQIRATAVRETVSPAPTTTTNPTTGVTSTTQTAFITTGAENSAAFQVAIKSLVSGQIDPKYVGYVSPTDGVIMRSYVEVDSSGRVVPQTSRISLEIRDEYTNQTDTEGNTVPPITMTLPASSGYGYNGQVQLLFQDGIGKFEVRGVYNNGGNLSGQFWFANTKKFDGSSASGVLTALGGFQIQTCGFFKCQ